ncbi:MAG TPA: isoleucine--tRNA ligase [Armatimonadota bacterium]
MFRSVDSQVQFPKLEESLVQWWKDSGVAQRGLAGREDGPDFIFFEGPPTANGRPGVHHVLARAFKDIILRYKRMQGFHLIGARGGWDTQGLPVEVEVEKELQLNGKRDIEQYGIAPFNEKCRASVFRYVQDWEKMTDRIAYWIDLEHPYITYTNDYLESGWWMLKTLWDKGLLFRDYKVNMHCPRCVTTLADHEVAQGYKENTEDPSIWPKFRVKTVEGALPAPLTGLPEPISFLAWTTTPWTLPANVAVAVKPDGVYVAARKDDEVYILAEELLERNLGEDAEVLRRFAGSELAGLRYEYLYRGVPGAGDQIDWDDAYRVIADDYVSLDDGTGIVHIAPAYGDLEIGRRHGLPTLFSVDLQGMMLPELQQFDGRFFKEADPFIIKELQERGLMYKSARTKHTYPFCWRCQTPLLFFAKSSWYIRTTAHKPQLIAGNQEIHWEPEHIKNGRFGNWLENNIDWAISRQRYWGTPLPIWECACGHQECIGSVAELSEKAGRDLTDLDLHRPYVDGVNWACPQCGGEMHRVPDVLDAWFDSGAMPVAQWHYPFENQALFAKAGQADFISEAVDQTRGWFYSLHALSTLLFDRPAFKNVICLGHILDEKGLKMSKSKGNIVDPWTVLNEHGADALRWYLYTCTTPGNPRRFSSHLVGETVRKFLLTLWNTYSFFITYANLDEWTPKPVAADDLALIDKWALSRLQALVGEVTTRLDGYEVTEAARAVEGFVDELSNWYLRRNRRRFWKSEADSDKQAAYYTLYTCLLTVAKLMAPFAPFISEEIYRNLTIEQGLPESVHLADWPVVDAARVDMQLDKDMAVLLKVVELGRSSRAESGLKVRQPLAELLVHVPGTAEETALTRFLDEVREELNVKAVRFMEGSSGLVQYRFKPNLPVVGRKYGKLVPALRNVLQALESAQAQAIAEAAQAGQTFTLLVEGQTLELTGEEILIESSSPEGFAVAEDGGYVVALNTEITEELRREGLARDLVRNVQDARKDAGLQISDRIGLFLGLSEELATAISAHLPYLMSETLADAVTFDAAPADAYTTQAELGGEPLTIGIAKSV